MSHLEMLSLRPADLAVDRPYVERDESEPGWHDRLASGLWHGAAMPLVRTSRLRNARARALVRRIDAAAARAAALDDDGLRRAAHALRPRLRRDGFAPAPVVQAFALVREAAARTLGKRHYPSQLMAAWWLLHGSLVEMATGEGKTFAATLAAVTAALAGLPVHVITVNDYLAGRDAELMDPLYRFFGLSVGTVVHGMERAARRAAYACDIAYASNKELAFDYLRDRTLLGERAGPLHVALQALHGGERGALGAGAASAPSTVMRGLVFGIVDEADSVFIDEARTPLILSVQRAPGDDARRPCDAALAVAARLAYGEHYRMEAAHRQVWLTDAGREAVEAAGLIDESFDAPGDVDGAATCGAEFPSARIAHEAVERALAARLLYRRDQHYVVVDGKVQIVDESTGRAMPDRAWERGLHQMIEAKEGLALTGGRETLARITYQRLFRRYLRLGGMSGTATEVAAEIGRTYGLPVVRVPLHRPSRRRDLGARCLPDAAAKWLAVADAVDVVARTQGRPVLVGTRTVQASEQLSARLAERGIEHVVLNARQDRDEAAIVGAAGQAGRVTVATNMAGRGTDILLGDGVTERGGLHVILTEYHESRRIDRQLVGRCARQGDPGSAEAIVALDDELFVAHAPWLLRALAPVLRAGGRGAAPALALLRRVAQSNAESRHRDARDGSLASDRRQSRTLAFAGRGE